MELHLVQSIWSCVKSQHLLFLFHALWKRDCGMQMLMKIISMLPLLPRIEFASLKKVTRGPSHKTVLVLRSHIFEPQKCIYWSTFLPGRANPCPIISEHGILMTCFVFPFQILGGLSGAIFMKKYFWPLGMTLFHSTINATVSKGQSHRRNDF